MNQPNIMGSHCGKCKRGAMDPIQVQAEAKSGKGILILIYCRQSKKSTISHFLLQHMLIQHILLRLQNTFTFTTAPCTEMHAERMNDSPSLTH